MQEFKKRKLSKVLIVFFIICLLVMIACFSKGNILPGLVALVQVILFACAWLMGMQFVKEKVPNLHILLAVIGFVLIIPYMMLSGRSSSTHDREDYEVSSDYERQNTHVKTEQAKDTELPKETKEEPVQVQDTNPKDESMTQAQTTQEASVEQSNTAEIIRPEFKAAMDSYEKFFDEYCEFMKKYSSSDNAYTMMADYAKYITQYADFAQKLDALGEEEMSDAEALYYMEVSMRIEQKLLAVAVQ